MGGKYESTLGTGVDSALITEQLIAGVGVLIMVGTTRTTEDVGVVFAWFAQELRMKILAMKNNKIKVRFFICLFWAITKLKSGRDAMIVTARYA